jgi:excisionase family DNA binding protein
MFSVDSKTVTRWARAGKITAIRTLGGHRRYRESEVRRLLDEGQETEQLLGLLNEALALAESLARTLDSPNALEQVREMREDKKKLTS